MAVIKKQNSYMGLPMNIARGNPVPLDTTEIWYNFEDLKTYAKTGVTAYVGQIVQYVDETNKTSTAYIIANTDGDLLEVGSATLGDNKTIELTDEGVLRLVGSNTAEVGAQLVMGANNTVTWVKPDTTTVEGLNTAVDALQKSVQNHETRLTDAEGDIADIQATLAGMGGIFNFAGALTALEFGNTSAENYDAGDVVLVDGVKEYVCIEYTENDVVKKRWEVLGDPSGVEEVRGKVELLETWKTSATNTLSELSTGLDTANTNITNLSNKTTGLETTLGTKADQSELNIVKADVQTNATSISTINGSIDSINTALNEKADKTALTTATNQLQANIDKKADQETVNNIINNYATDAELTEGLSTKVDKTAYNEKMSALETADSSNATAIAGVKATADKAATDIAELKETVAGKASAQSVTDLTTRVRTNETNIGQNTAAINSLSGTVTGLSSTKADKTAVTELANTVAANTKAISDHATEYSALKDRVDGHDTSIAKAQEDATKGINDAAAASAAASAAQAKGEEALTKAESVLGTSADAASANTVFGAKAAAAAAQEKANTAQDEVDALEQVVTNLDAAYKTADSALGARIDAIDKVIGGVQGAMHFIGISTINPAVGNVVAIEGKDDYTPVNGDVVIYKDEDNNTLEYIYSDGVWVELGDVSAEAKRIEALEERAATLETATAKIPGIQDDISALKTAKAALEARVKANEDAIAEHTTAIGSLTTRIGDAEVAITKNASDLRAELAAKAKSIEDALAEEATLRETADAELQRQINVINGQLTWTKLTSV